MDSLADRLASKYGNGKQQSKQNGQVGGMAWEPRNLKGCNGLGLQVHWDSCPHGDA